MLALLTMLLAADPPRIDVAPEGDHYRLTVGFFRISQGDEINELVDMRMQATCKGRGVQRLELDFQTVDPAGRLSTEPPVERAIWNYSQTFRCLAGAGAAASGPASR